MCAKVSLAIQRVRVLFSPSPDHEAKILDRRVGTESCIVVGNDKGEA